MRFRAHHTLILGALILFGSMWTLESLQTFDSQESSRYPANFPDKINQVSASLHFQNIPPEKLLQLADSRVPDRENFQFGTLRGEYQLWIDPRRQNRIWKVEAVVAEPTELNWKQLLESHSELFVGDFSRVETAQSGRSPSAEMEFLNLSDNKGQQQGRAVFKRNSSGALQSFWIESQ